MYQLVLTMKALRLFYKEYIYFIESTSLKIGREEGNDSCYVLYDGTRNKLNLKCIKHSRERSQSEYIIKLNWVYNETGITLDVHIPEGSIIVGAINDNVIYEGNIFQKDIKYNKDITLKIKNKSTQKYDSISLCPKKDINIDKSDDELKSNLVGPYENEKITQKGAEDIDEKNNLLSILNKLNSVQKVGRGGFRSVYNISNADIDFLHEADGDIIKVAMYQKSLEQNKREVQTWQTVKGTDLEKYFCPITNFGPNYKYVIMKKARDFTNVENKKDNYEKWSTKSDDLESMVNKFSKLSTYDISYDNIGEYNGNYVLIDYPFGANLEYENLNKK